MSRENLSIHFSTDQSPENVYDAINNVRGWWSEEITGDTDKLNGEFSYRYKDVHHCRIRVVELIQNKRVTWLVKDNYFSFIKDQREWKDTKILFEILRDGDRTELVFTHIGLTPEDECFDVCSNAWTGYITNSLRNLVATGKGEPNPKESSVEV